MTKHLTATELGFIQRQGAAGKSVAEIHAFLVRLRARHGDLAPTSNSVRRALKGWTRRRGNQETRGRTKAISSVKLKALDKARKDLQTETDGCQEVTLKMIRRRARVQAHPSTVPAS